MSKTELSCGSKQTETGKNTHLEIKMGIAALLLQARATNPKLSTHTLQMFTHPFLFCMPPDSHGLLSFSSPPLVVEQKVPLSAKSLSVLMELAGPEALDNMGITDGRRAGSRSSFAFDHVTADFGVGASDKQEELRHLVAEVIVLVVFFGYIRRPPTPLEIWLGDHAWVSHDSFPVPSRRVPLFGFILTIFSFLEPPPCSGSHVLSFLCV